jgi:hypothetical protein
MFREYDERPTYQPRRVAADANCRLALIYYSASDRNSTPVNGLLQRARGGKTITRQAFEAVPLNVSGSPDSPIVLQVTLTEQESRL